MRRAKSEGERGREGSERERETKRKVDEWRAR